MKIIGQLITGTGGLNESGIVRFCRLAAIGAAIGGLDAAMTGLTGLHLPDPALTVPLITAGIAGAEKWLRSRAPATPVKPPSTP